MKPYSVPELIEWMGDHCVENIRIMEKPDKHGAFVCSAEITEPVSMNVILVSVGEETWIFAPTSMEAIDDVLEKEMLEKGIL